MTRHLLLLTLFILTVTGLSAQDGPPPAPVVTAAVTFGPVPRNTRVPGELIPRRRSRLAAGHDGRLAELLVRAGDKVSAGQALAKLEASELTSQVTAARAEATLLKTRHEQSLRKLERSRRLHERERLSEEMYDDARVETQALEQELARSRARLAELEARLDSTILKAPYDGSVTTVFLEVGEWARRGGDLLEVVETDPLESLVALAETLAPHLDRDGVVKVTVSALDDRRLTGRITGVIPDLDPLSRTLPVRIAVDNASGDLTPGMSIVVDLPLTPGPAALMVPKDAVVKKGPMAFVFVVRDGLANMIPVTVTGYSLDHAVVTGPLEAGQAVVTRGNERLRPGQPVAAAPNAD